MSKRQALGSREAFIVEVDTVLTVGTNPDVTTDPVAFQFVVGGLPPRSWPTTGGWSAGYWMTTPTGLVLAAVDVGPGALVLARGKYAAWIRVTDDPDVVERPVDVLTIY